MEGPVFGIVLVGVLLLVAYLVSLNHRMEEQRAAELAAFAGELGFQFRREGTSEFVTEGFFAQLFSFASPTETSRLLSMVENFKPFGVGSSRAISNLIYGTQNDLNWYLFDYKYVTSSGKSTQTHNFSVVIVRVKLGLPSLTITPQNFLHSLSGLIGVHEVNFESDEFNQRYFVHGSDSKAIYDLFHPQALEYFLSLPVETWQLSGIFLVRYMKSHASSSDYRRFMREVRGFIELVPEYFKEDRGFDANWSDPMTGF